MPYEHSKSRILVGDDEEFNRDLLARRLCRKGFVVDCADGAAEAERQLESASYDLILLDIMMPEVDGFEYLEQIRERWEPAQLPVIMATAKDDADDIVRALKLGANDYVTKPLDFQVVMARVETQLQLKHATTELAKAHRLLQEDLQRASRLQRSQLPRPNLKVPGCQFAWTYLPCDALAGDFLNVIPLDATRTAFYVLDVSGHGTPAALMSSAASYALSATHNQSSVVLRSSSDANDADRGDVVSPRDVTAQLNRRFAVDENLGKYFTMAYIVFDSAAGELTFTLAGHPPQVYVPKGRKGELLECQGMPVGLLAEEELPEDSFQEKKISVFEGDRIYLFSDGLSEAMNEAKEQYTDGRLRDAIDQTQSLSLSASIESVLNSIKAFCGSNPFDDDMSILAIEIGNLDR